MAQCIKSFGASLWLLHIWHILTYQRNIFCSKKGESTHNTVNTSPVSSRLHLFGLDIRDGGLSFKLSQFPQLKVETLLCRYPFCKCRIQRGGDSGGVILFYFAKFYPAAI